MAVVAEVVVGAAERTAARGTEGVEGAGEALVRTRARWRTWTDTPAMIAVHLPESIQVNREIRCLVLCGSLTLPITRKSANACSYKMLMVCLQARMLVAQVKLPT
jgi:hypothetical protein